MNSLESLYPYVVSSSWVHHADRDSLISWQVSDDVYVVLVFDGKGTVRNARAEDLLSLGINEGQAFDAAASNLGHAWERQEFSLGIATLLDGVEIGGVRGSWMAPAGGLILGNFYLELKNHFGRNEFVAVAVNQEFLLAFPADKHTLASASLKLAINDEFTGHRKPISRQWLLLDGQWPRQFPGEQLF